MKLVVTNHATAVYDFFFSGTEGSSMKWNHIDVQWDRD